MSGHARLLQHLAQLVNVVPRETSVWTREAERKMGFRFVPPQPSLPSSSGSPYDEHRVTEATPPLSEDTPLQHRRLGIRWGIVLLFLLFIILLSRPVLQQHLCTRQHVTSGGVAWRR